MDISYSTSNFYNIFEPVQYYCLNLANNYLLHEKHKNNFIEQKNVGYVYIIIQYIYTTYLTQAAVFS